MIRSYHTGLHDWSDLMLFDLQHDPHEVTDLADARPDVVGRCEHLLNDWWSRQQTQFGAGRTR